jgi:hypothetical protein
MFGVGNWSAVAATIHVRPQQTSVKAVRLPGQVIAVLGQTSNPTGFTLQMRDRTVDVKVVARRTNFVARSPEAQVEGFGPHVFAIVTASRTNGDWVAARVEYDVVPFGAVRDFAVSGKITWIDKKGRNFRLRMTSGDIHVIRVNRQTRFDLDGLPVDIPPTLSAGNLVDVAVHRNVDDLWLAVTLNLKSSGPGH